MNLNDKPQQITGPVTTEKFSDNKAGTCNVLITNGYLNYNTEGRHHQFVSEERLKSKLEKVLIEKGGQIMLPVSSKSLAL